MRMERRKFRIGELANHLAVERFVIRFWEKEFDIKAHRSTGGQRFYDEQDLLQFKTIKTLLYEKKFTIAGAKQMLETHEKQNLNVHDIVASQITTLDEALDSHEIIPKKIVDDLIKLRHQLTSLQKLL